VKENKGRDESFVFYESYFKATEKLPQQDQLTMYKAIIKYGLYDHEPKLDGALAAVFCAVQPNLDTNKNRYRACVKNGKRGGRPAKEKQTETKIKPLVSTKETKQKPLVIEKETKGKSLVIQNETSGFDNGNQTETTGFDKENPSYSSSYSLSLSSSLSPSLTSSSSYSSSYAADVAAIKKGQLPKPTTRNDVGFGDWVERIFNRFKDLVQSESGHVYIGKSSDKATIEKMVDEKGGEQVSARQSLFYVACCNEKNHLQNFNVENFAYNWAYIDEKMNVKSKPIGDKPTIIYDVRDAARDAEAAAAAAQASDTDETNEDDIEDIEREIEGDSNDNTDMQ
jgi:hypothetical protein